MVFIRKNKSGFTYKSNWKIKNFTMYFDKKTDLKLYIWNK